MNSGTLGSSLICPNLAPVTLLSYRYTIVIKVIIKEKEHLLKVEVVNYHHLRGLQGVHIPSHLKADLV
jgi:hypothetical protein